jgi:UDP-N-acetylmuramyl pentapeptide phosphotransferase/UDP-N-acetylglucosamine-1-phosphate transferase
VSELVWWPLLAFCLTAGCIWLLLKSGLAGRMVLDQPIARSLHVAALPRSGGAVMMAAISLASLPVMDGLAPTLRLALLLGCVSLLDDRIGLPVIPRLAVQVVCAVFGIVLIIPVTAPAISLPLILLLVWATNLYNFMDGANGLVGGASLIGFGFMGWGFFAAGHFGEAAICWIIAMSAFGFLLFNADPARIFMGDSWRDSMASGDGQSMFGPHGFPS